MSHLVLDRFRHAFSKQRRPGGSKRLTAVKSTNQKRTVWDRIPVDILTRILVHCTLTDIYHLMLSCRALNRQIHREEYTICRKYLEWRRRWSFGHWNEISDASPGEDLTFISDLFPPQPPQYSDISSDEDRPEYCFGYLADLNRCWVTCIRLSYYLADYVVRHHLQTDPDARPLWSSSKTEKEVVYSKGVGMLQSRLLYPIAYLAFFLETHAADRAMSTGNGQPPRLHHSLQDQLSILQRPPFTTTEVLLTTHHCMHLLCCSVRRMMAPEIPHSSAGSWVSLLLTTSTLERILDFFIANAHDQTTPPRNSHASPISHTHQHTHKKTASSSWTKRRGFLLQMREDWKEYLALAEGSRSGGEGNRIAPPELRQVWFEAAEEEMHRRGVMPHRSEEPIHILHGSAVRLRCGFCDDD